jgi:hypothetical protein
MQRLSSQKVVEQIASELADRRRSATRCRAAYLALVRAILEDDADVQRESMAPTQAARAA